MIRYMSVAALMSVSLVACATTDLVEEPIEETVETAVWDAERPDPSAEFIGRRCIVTGCSGQVCSDRPVYTTCEWRPEYACYADATCERQDNGACGWTPTDELKQCIEDAGNGGPWGPIVVR